MNLFEVIIVTKGGLNRHKESVHKDRSYYCDKCGFPAAKKEKMKSHMEAVHRDKDFNVTSVISQQHKRGNLVVIKKISINILKIKSDMGNIYFNYGWGTLTLYVMWGNIYFN